MGYGGLGGGGTFQIFAKAPDQPGCRSILRITPNAAIACGRSTAAAGWVHSPRGLLKEYEVTGSELDGLRLDAQMCFPGQIKQTLTNLHVGAPDSINGREVDVVQGTSLKGILATLYFDKESGLLVRSVRYGKSPVGRVPTQFDYGDYRDVSGIKFCPASAGNGESVPPLR